MSYTPKNKVRIVTAASLFDGHDAAIAIMQKVMAAYALDEIGKVSPARQAREVLKFLFGKEFANQFVLQSLGQVTSIDDIFAPVPSGLKVLEAYLAKPGQRKGFLSFHVNQCTEFIKLSNASSNPQYKKELGHENGLETIQNDSVNLKQRLRKTGRNKNNCRKGGGLNISAILRLLKNNNYERLEQIINKLHRRFAKKKAQQGLIVDSIEFYKYATRAIERMLNNICYSFQIDKKIFFRRQVRRLFKCLNDVSEEADYFNNTEIVIANHLNINLYGTVNCKANIS